VKNPKIGAGAVTGGKIAANAVTGGKIAPGAVGPTDLAAVPYARVRQGTPQTFPTGTGTLIQVNLDQLEVSGGGLTLEDNALRIGTTGVYFIHGTIGWTSNATGARQAVLTRNNTIIGAANDIQASAAGNTVQGVSALLRLVDGETIELNGRQFSGGDLTTVGFGIAGTTLSAFWVGP
jgi:hypothetical protein